MYTKVRFEQSWTEWPKKIRAFLTILKFWAFSDFFGLFSFFFILGIFRTFLTIFAIFRKRDIFPNNFSTKKLFPTRYTGCFFNDGKKFDG